MNETVERIAGHRMTPTQEHALELMRAHPKGLARVSNRTAAGLPENWPSVAAGTMRALAGKGLVEPQPHSIWDLWQLVRSPEETHRYGVTQGVPNGARPDTRPPNYTPAYHPPLSPEAISRKLKRRAKAKVGADSRRKNRS